MSRLFLCILGRLLTKEFGIIGFVEMFLFVGILMEVFFMSGARASLDWVKMQIRNPKGRYKHLASKITI